ncbi:sulfatase [Planctomycetota bacterium]
MSAREDRMTRRELLQFAGAIGTGAIGLPLATRLLPSKQFGPSRIDVEGIGWQGTAKFPDRRPITQFPKKIPPSRHKRPNVVLIVLDTVRADHLSCYGYHRQTTPNIDAFAARSRVYDNVLSPGGWTLPSHASLFTGLPISAHGTRWWHQTLEPRFETLAGKLLADGYQTAGLSSNEGFVSARCGLDRGFEHFEAFDCFKDGLGGAAHRLQPRLAEWFARQYDGRRPFFLFLNYMEAHDPYLAPTEHLEWASPETRQKWKKGVASLMEEFMYLGRDAPTRDELLEVEGLYDSALHYLDAWVGEFLDFLETSGLAENTLVLITSDHGEHFGEKRRLLHWLSLYEPVVRVPLILGHAGHVPPGRVTDLVQAHDAFATILDYAGVERERDPAGNSRNLLEAPSTGESRYAFSEYFNVAQGRTEWGLNYPKVDFTPWFTDIKVVQRGSWKLIHFGYGREELYDLSKDPAELHNLADEKPDVVKTFLAQLDNWLRSFPQYVAPPPWEGRAAADVGSGVLTPEEEKQFRGLGYIH